MGSEAGSEPSPEKDRKKRLGIVLLVVFFFGFGLWNMGAPKLIGLFAENRILRIDAAAKALFGALDAASRDPQVGLPADCGIKSTAEYLELLAGKGYLKREDLALFAGFILGNVSANDPARTVILISRPYYEYITQGARFPKDSVFIRKGGDAQILSEPIPPADFPPRAPPFLTP